MSDGGDAKQPPASSPAVAAPPEPRRGPPAVPPLAVPAREPPAVPPPAVPTRESPLAPIAPVGAARASSAPIAAELGPLGIPVIEALQDELTTAVDAAEGPQLQVAPPRPRDAVPLRPVTVPPRPSIRPTPGRNPDSSKKRPLRRARAVEAEADLWAALDSGPPSIPSAAEAEAPAPVEPPKESSATHTSGLMVGQTLADRYETLSVLGEGGMGIVYRCRDTYSDDDVALKRVIIPEGPLANEYVMWFYKESRALATLDHPSIVRARDFGQLSDGSPFLVMDLANGVSLHELAHAHLGFPLIWSIIDQMLGALAHAHARGIIHGDLKPSNILVEEVSNEPPRVHVLDFGLAWLKQDRHDERLDGHKALEFAPHSGAGTPGYMAPEQIQHESHNVCGATDLYSLGCILYKMLTGRAPFSGDSKELLRHHAFDPPPVPRVTTPDAPPDVAHFVMRLLAKQPWDRWEFSSEARSEWARWRPRADLDVLAWRFPLLPRTKGQSQPPPPPAPPRAASPSPRGPFGERTPGLLSIRQSPLVGREEARQALREACDDTVDGRPPTHRMRLLVGPAGVGKSRLAEWLYEVVGEEGTMVPLRARYRPLRGPLDGMVGAVTQYFNFERSDRDTIERTLLARWKVGRHEKAGRTWVAGVAEWLRPLGPIADQPIGPSGIRFTLDTPETRRMVIRYALRRIARGRPLLLWLDDLHHASDTTLEGLLKIHEEEPDQRIVFVATLRTEDYQLDSRLAERLKPLLTTIEHAMIEVRPMDPDATCVLLRAALPLDDDSVHEAARRSRGNPLFALQQLHAWALGGDISHSSGRYHVSAAVLAMRPKTTAELWDSRILALPAEHRLAAYAAASLGADIRRAVLHALLEALQLPTDAVMLSLQTAEILVPRGPGRYTWPHALLQEHLAERLTQRDDSRRILRAAAEALTRHPLAGTRRVVRQRVVNLLGAGDPDAAAQLLFDFLQTSGGAAREPLSLLTDLDLLKGKLQGRSLALKHRWQAEALRHLARNEEASMHAEIARATFEELGDRENLAHSLRLLGHITAERGRSAEGLSLIEQARGLFEDLANVPGLAQCEVVAAEVHFAIGETTKARSLVERGQSHFASLGQHLGRGQCLLLLGTIEQAEGNIERARRRISEAHGEFERAGYRLGLAQADVALAHIEHRLLNFHNAARGSLDALSTFDELSTPRNQAACERLLAMIGIDTDDVDLAELHTDRALRVYERLGDATGILDARLLLVQVALLRQTTEDARRALVELRRTEPVDPETRQHVLLVEAWLWCEENSMVEAFRRVEAAAEVFRERLRVGDHAPHLLARLGRYRWPPHAREAIEAWRMLLNDRSRHSRD